MESPHAPPSGPTAVVRDSSVSPMTRTPAPLSRATSGADEAAIAPRQPVTSAPAGPREGEISAGCTAAERDDILLGEARATGGPAAPDSSRLDGPDTPSQNGSLPPAAGSKSPRVPQSPQPTFQRAVSTPHLSHAAEASSAETNGPRDTLSAPRPAGNTGTTTPPGRRSVQFARPGSSAEQAERSHSRHGSGTLQVDVDADTPTRERKGFTLFSKLRALAGPAGLPSHARSQSGHTTGEDAVDRPSPVFPLSPEPEREEVRYPSRLSEEGDDTEADADAEESATEDASWRRSHGRRRKHSRRLPEGGPHTAPTTPKAMLERNGRLGAPLSPASHASSSRPDQLGRRATMTDIPEDGRAGMSEDEGRQRLQRDSAWRRGSSWVHAGRVPGAPPEGRRPSNLRRLTGFGAGVGTADGGEAPPPVPWRQRAERTTTLSAHKWRALKAGLKMMGQKRKEENKVDHAKSAELLAELAAGTPAALILASTFQRDDKGNRRIPVLLEQLKLRLTDSKRVDNKALGDRHQIFRIELEYGSGLTRMKWIIHRALRDFTNLHLRYKLQASSDKYKHLYGHDDLPRQKLPRFPRTAFPYLRGARGFGSDDEEEGEWMVDDDTGPSGAEGTASGTDGPSRRRRRRPSIARSRRSSRVNTSRSSEHAVGPTSGPATLAGGATAANLGARREPYAERQRKKLEVYLQLLIRHLIFRPDANRLCKFLELSALGVRLAAEGGYHGKEGSMVIQSSKGLDFRRGLNPALFTRRHSPKWFLVRHSYIVCVDSPEEMNIYDVLLVDPAFELLSRKRRLRDKRPRDLAISAKNTAAHPQHHALRLRNSERRVKLLAKNERQLLQFEESIEFMAANTAWARSHRFDSFAPVRTGVFAQWLVDGRDYMWNVSRAIAMAHDVIYIHDWWLSPELYMRRPAAISQKWRLDRLLQRKANEGVKIFVIVYRNINSAIPIDSSYTKFSLLDLHPNVFVQRSPNQIRQNTFFWAHHEKLCVVDHTVAFVGGIDLCFGRWDTPQHAVCDDKPTGFEASDAPKDADHCQLWPGKDYSNPRVQDFYALDKPYEEMYDRTKVPRMPWHDISMQVVGQPARDLTRHFVQRWNYILRQRNPTRPTPFLLPPPDFNPADLEALGLDGTCEVQMLRSCGWWSMGTPAATEHSIMNAYVKTIEQSEHFVYVENQFFVSSCEVEGTRIENTIGDALVERIARASRNGEDWRAVIVIPLMPGFQNTVDSQDGTSVRLIMQCQYRSICRGETSIFGRLRAADVEPEDYIQFYGLRTWGRIGPSRMLVTEQLYIHAKCMIVDDRVAIIGSANINERSMRGERDSECAAIVRDTDMVRSTMNGEPYMVGRFPHSLRMRLMREHLGLDVDEIMEDERRADPRRQHDRSWERDMDGVYRDDETASDASPAADAETRERLAAAQHRTQDELLAKSEGTFSFNHDVDWEQANNPNVRSGKRLTEDKRVTGNAEHREDVDGLGVDKMADEARAGLAHGRDTALVDGGVEVLVANVASEGRGSLAAPVKDGGRTSSAASPSRGPRDDAAPSLPPPPAVVRMNTAELGLPMTSQLPALPLTDDSDIGGPAVHRTGSGESAEHYNPVTADMRRPMVDKDCMKDPLSDSFHLDTWHAVAENNTKLYRHVFRCMPDNEVKTWKEYKEYAAYAERFTQAQGGGKSKSRMQQEAQGKSGPPGQNSVAERVVTLASIGEKADGVTGGAKRAVEKPAGKRKKGGDLQLGRVQDWAEEANRAQRERHERDESSPEKNQGGGRSAEQMADEREKKGGGGGGSAEQVLSEKDGTLSSPEGTAQSLASEGEKMQRMQSPPFVGYSEALNMNQTSHSTSQRRRRRTGTRTSRREFQASDDIIDMGEAEEMMKLTQGHLVVWPHEWLAREEQGGNWLYSIDQLAPLEIYN
ncbi:MAG: Phospholipase D1 [Thelocarpon impressellum]|nr:MAG: Phospholipase D1 [Thelocarpon impressellum]